MKHVLIFLLVTGLPMGLAVGVACAQSQPVAASVTHDWSPGAASAAPPATATPPPSAPPRRGTAELEKLAAPIALYPDPLIALILPASAYPLEIVQAARFVKDTNNIAQLDQQPWDQNVKALASFPDVLQKMDADLAWTVALGQAFQEQDLDLMNAIQALRAKASSAGTLQTTPQQVVIVTNAVVERTVEQQIVYVTNTIVQIQPADPQVIYVPQYNPTVIYAPPPAYVYDPLVPLLTFGVGIAVGAIIANNCCNWYYGGVYCGGGFFVAWGGGYGCPPYYPPPYYGYRPPPYHPPPGWHPPPPAYRPPGYGPPGYHPPPGYRPPAPGYRPPAATPYPAGQRPPASMASQTPASMQRWQPDQSRLRTAGAPSPSQNLAQRGWASPKPAPAWKPVSSTANTITRPAGSTSFPASRTSQPTSDRKPASGTANTVNRPGGATSYPASGSSRAPATGPSFSRPATTPAPVPTQGAAASTASRSSQASAPAASVSRGSPASNRPSVPASSYPSAFRGVGNGSSAWDSSQRGATSRASSSSGGSAGLGGWSGGSGGKGGGLSVGGGGRSSGPSGGGGGRGGRP